MNTDAEYHILSILREIQEALKQNGITSKKVVTPTPVTTPVVPVPLVSTASGPAIGHPAIGAPLKPK
jgi:hypothetical protein